MYKKYISVKLLAEFGIDSLFEPFSYCEKDVDNVGRLKNRRIAPLGRKHEGVVRKSHYNGKASSNFTERRDRES